MQFHNKILNFKTQKNQKSKWQTHCHKLDEIYFGICATDKCAPFNKDSFTVRIPKNEYCFLNGTSWRVFDCNFLIYFPIAKNVAFSNVKFLYFHDHTTFQI